MSPAVIALARTFTDDRPDEEQAIDRIDEATEKHSSSVHRPKSKSRSSSNSALVVPGHYHYDPYHQYCRTGSDFYKSYHLSYQAYCHAPKSKFIDTTNGGSHCMDQRFYDRIATLRSPTNRARARASSLRRKITQFRERTSAWIQRLALITISVTFLSFIFARSLIPGRIDFNPLPFRNGILNKNSLVELTKLTLSGLPNTSFIESIGSERETQLCDQLNGKRVFENLFESTSIYFENLPIIPRSVFIKFYALGFLAFLIGVSFVCEQLFGRKLAIPDSNLFDEDESDIFVSDDDDLLDEREDDTEIDSYAMNDLYWDCQPTKVPILPLGKFLVHPPHVLIAELKILLLFMLPLRLISRIWGLINAIHLPVAARAPLFTWYSNTFGCNLEEMLVQDLSQFRNLSEFFRRELKAGLRPIGKAEVVSPADGRVVQLEPVSLRSGYVGSVKGIYYSLDNFLGSNVAPSKLKPAHRLYSCVVYLAPGDYHRFHSPADWTVQLRRHFSGRLLSVKPSFVAQVPDLFATNERVVYAGSWKHGFFSLTAVGATNVGTVNVFFDQELQTNSFAYSLNHHSDKSFQSITVNKGDLFGEFNLGSTMVLIFEAPESIHFSELLDQKIKYGENILLCPSV